MRGLGVSSREQTGPLPIYSLLPNHSLDKWIKMRGPVRSRDHVIYLSQSQKLHKSLTFDANSTSAYFESDVLKMYRTMKPYPSQHRIQGGQRGGGGGARNMKCGAPRMVAIFFMTMFLQGQGGHGPLAPPPLDPQLLRHRSTLYTSLVTAIYYGEVFCAPLLYFLLVRIVNFISMRNPNEYF